MIFSETASHPGSRPGQAFRDDAHQISRGRMKILITGATGLLGRQVVKEFKRGGWDVVGTGLTRASPPSILKVDLGSEFEVKKVIEDVKYVALPLST